MIAFLRPFLLTSLFLPCLTHAAPHRGVWFWNKTSIWVDGVKIESPHSSKFVVGDGVKEDEAIRFMRCQKIKEVYGSYQNRPRDEPLPIRAWNAKLYAAGIESQLLISGFDPEDTARLADPDHLELVENVQERLIDFNNTPGMPATERFTGLHLDLEPQSLEYWQDTATEADKRLMLEQLRDAYADIRAALDAAGFAGFPIYADIPYTWDKMPAPHPDAGSIGWASASDRDGWFAAISAQLTGISIMTFSASKDTLPELADATEYERMSGFFGGTVHVAVQPKVGPGEIWPTYPTFSAIVVGLETAYGEAHVENYAFWRQAYEEYGPVIIKPCFNVAVAHAEPSVINNGNGGGGVIIVGNPGYIYRLKHSITLGDNSWKDAGERRLDPQDGHHQSVEFPVQFAGPRGFWIVSETAEGDEQTSTP